MSAFMTASLSYTLVGHFFSAKALPLPPNPWFILVLILIIPAATLGAMLVNWNRQWNPYDTWDCLCTGLVSTLPGVALVKGMWTLFLHASDQPTWLLLLLLLVSSITATLGTNSTISGSIIYGIGIAMAKLRAGVMAITMLVGGLFGYILTADFVTPFGILLGIGVAIAIVWRVDQFMKQQAQSQN
jgi:hypothetical protein